MIRNLLIISGVGLVLAAAGIGGSLAVGGADLARHSWVWVIKDDDNGGLNIRRTQDEIVAEDITRQIAWDDTERLSISLPGSVLYVQDATAPAITITGPKTLVDRVSFVNGQLLLNSTDESGTAYVGFGKNGIRGWSDSVKVTINAASAKAFELSGNSELEVRGYDQPTLDLVLTGSSEVDIRGRANAITVDASGNSSAELDELIGADAVIRASGNADVKTAANGSVNIEASGNSSVRLTRNVSSLRQSLTGEAEVRQD